VVLDDDGILRKCRASGHAKAGKKGSDVICAAVSVLMFAALKTLSNRKGITVSGDWPEEGEIWLETCYDADGKDFLFAAGVFLIEGLKFVAQDYPENCRLDIIVRRN